MSDMIRQIDRYLDDDLSDNEIAELFEWTSNWAVVLLLFAGIYLVGAICWAFVDCRQRITDTNRPAAGPNSAITESPDVRSPDSM